MKHPRGSAESHIVGLSGSVPMFRSSGFVIACNGRDMLVWELCDIPRRGRGRMMPQTPGTLFWPPRSKWNHSTEVRGTTMAMEKISRLALMAAVALLWLVSASATVAEENSEAFYMACCNGKVEVASLFLDQGTDVDVRSQKHGMTGLMCASKNGWTSVIRLLLDRDAEIDARSNKSQSTALMFAAVQNKLTAVELLLEEGAEVSVRNYQGLTAVDMASKRGYTEVVKALLNHSAGR